MATVVVNPPEPEDDRSPSADRIESALRLRRATLLTAASFLFLWGIAWDVQWHADVGPDTFWTAPHTTFYSSVALAGIVSLLTGLRSTQKYGKPGSGVSDRTTTPWLGVFHAPLGFIVSGLGAAAFLISGVYDLWWHTLYGFDVTLLSPPHFGLLFSGPVIMVGTVYAFASETNRAKARGDEKARRLAALGVSFNVAVLLAQLSFFLIVAFDNVQMAGPFITYALLASMLFPAGLLAVASFVRRPGAATVSALFFLAIRWFMLWATPLAASVQANVQSLPYKSDPLMVSALGEAMPAYLFAWALVIDLALAAAERLKIGLRPAIWAGAALGAVVNYLIDPRWISILYSVTQVRGGSPESIASAIARFDPGFVPTLIIVPMLAALSGWFGWNFGVVLRFTDK